MNLHKYLIHCKLFNYNLFYFLSFFIDIVIMKKYSNNDRITNDLTRMAYKNNDFNNPGSYRDLNNTLDARHLLPQVNTEPFNNTSKPINPFKDIIPNEKQFSRNVEKIDNDLNIARNNLFTQKDKTINDMNSEINKLKNNLQEVIKKDKEIQELKNKLTLINKELGEKSGLEQKIKDLEMELKFVKKKLDDEYLISSEVKTIKKDIDNIKQENISLRKKLLEMNQKTNLFKLKKIIHKHTNCDLDKLNEVLCDNDITEDSFILNSINENLIKKVIGYLNDSKKS